MAVARCVCRTRWCGRLTGQRRWSVRLAEEERASVDHPLEPDGSAGFKERPSWVEGEIISGILDIK